MRTEGFTPSAMQIGDVRIELGPQMSGPVNFPFSPGHSIVEEYGGAEIAKLLNQSDGVPDLVDDDEQPAVRSSS